MRSLRRSSVGVACLSVTAFVIAAGQQEIKAAKEPKEDDAKRPKVTLKAQPTVSMSPSRVVLTAELVGGPNDYEEFYCPTVEWDWGDGTQSESTTDCDPYVAGKSEIKRRFTVQHIFRAGNFRVMFRLKRNDKPLAAATATIQVQPGVRDLAR
jgi:hypothetical protein